MITKVLIHLLNHRPEALMFTLLTNHKGTLMEIRPAISSDYPGIAHLLKESFSATEHGYDNEAELVEKIRLDPSYQAELELVVANDSQIYGYGMMSEVQILTSTNSSSTGLVLAPLAVAPNKQQQGIGTTLMHELEQRANKLHYPYISILGHPDYYRRFGYLPASKFDVKPPYPLPDEAFMLKVLLPETIKNMDGTLHYSAAFE